MLEVADAHVRFGDAHVLRGGNLSAQAGRLVTIVGPNGAGKSTLVRVAAGLQRPHQGSVRWNGTDAGRLRGRALALARAFVPQRIAVPAGVRVADAVAIGRAPHLRALQAPRRHDRAAVEHALVRAGVAGMRERLLSTLSGGELQRVQIAVALAQEAPALIADEPTAHLDLGASAEIARLLRGLADDGLAVVVVVHDLALAAAIADEVIVMSDGETVACGPAADVLDPARVAEVWGVDAELDVSGARTALRVSWLEHPIVEAR